LLAQLAQAIFDISLQEIFIALIQLLFGHDLGVSLVRIFGIACRCGGASDLQYRLTPLRGYRGFALNGHVRNDWCACQRRR
jgi:hypothetical protein